MAIKPEVQAIIDRHAAIDWRNPPHDPARAMAAYQRRLAAVKLIRFSPGTYEVRRQREYVPEGFRQVQD